jgi:hypothetical protein
LAVCRLNKRKEKLVLQTSIFLPDHGGWSAANGSWWWWGEMSVNVIMQMITSLTANLGRSAVAADNKDVDTRSDGCILGWLVLGGEAGYFCCVERKRSLVSLVFRCFLL